jgi:hypothetical protein
MADVLIRTPKEWEDLAKNMRDEKISKSYQFFVEHDMAAEFSVWAIKRAITKGIAIGTVGTLFFVVMLGFIVRLMT